ncbi:MAG: nucleotidyltransferase domain-containing protein [Clostridiales bacterium]|nr:nucleotidyltransferase domain-containing protein [Clostridiales bacterium]
MDKSERRAREIIQHHIQNIAACAADDVLSVVLVGSLSNGSYTGSAGSDIDLIHILRDDAPPDAREKLLYLIAQTEAETGGDIPLSRCVYRLSQLHIPYANLEGKAEKDLAELPIELLRMRESGMVLFGEAILNEIRVPERVELLACFRRARENTERLAQSDPAFYAQYQQTIQNPSMRILTQIVLTRAMRDLYFAAHEVCCSKLEIAKHLRYHVPNYASAELLALCTRWRYDPTHFSDADESRAKALYREWCLAREGRDVDFVPIVAGT